MRCGASKNTSVRCSCSSAAEPAGPLARLAWQEALEAEPVDRQAGDRERGQHRRRAGDAGDGDVPLDGRRDEPVARVGDAGHAGVGDQHDAVATEERLQQGLGAEVLVALEVGHHPAGDLDPEVGGQAPQPPGVLGRDHVGALQLGGEPGRGVVGAADGRRGQHEHAGRFGHGTDHGSRRLSGREPPRPARAHGRALAHRRRARRTECCAPRPPAGTGPRPVHRLGRDAGGHAARCLPAAVGPREAARVPVRRDLLRQGRVVPAPPRLLAGVRREGEPADPRRAHLRPVDRRAEHGRAPGARQVADRAGRERLRDGPVRLADRLGRRGRADGAGDDPPRAPGHPLHDARPRRGAADVLRRPAPGAVPAGPAGPVRRLLHALRRQLHGRRPRLGPRADGAVRADGHAALAGVVGAVAAVAAVAAGHGCVLGTGRRHEVVGAVPAGRLRPADVGLGLRRAPLLRRTRCGVEVSPDRRGAGPGLRRAGATRWSTWPPGRDGCCTPPSTSGPSPTPSTAPTGATTCGWMPGASSPSCGSRCARCGTTTTTSMPSTPGSSTTASTSTSRTRGAGWC